ncbi:putative quinol monooxygenase [Brevundimonas sp. SORGH_AS_0993]|uniref:putative quinol monooxygenase n=1 Tax=Brevundimonas sp. SORGH_AS_0993 TaxID=3041794 RepID=UPI0035945065
MYGLITRLVAHPGRRDELALILLDPTLRRHGCHSYVVAHDLAHTDTLWVTEIWTDAETHEVCTQDIRKSGVWAPSLAFWSVWTTPSRHAPWAASGFNRPPSPPPGRSHRRPDRPRRH